MSDVGSQWKERVASVVDDLRHDLVGTSHAIHNEPELAFDEHRAAARLADALSAVGYTVERSVGGLETAFRATIEGGQPGPTIAILAEYDALPGIGHGCGHNIIATSALGAGWALRRSDTPFAGRIQIIGTPAEEGGGGKILLADAGVFEGVDAAIMMHPSTRYMVNRGSLANSRVDITFHGKAAHAAGSPDKGINALDAVIQTFNGINARRLHMRHDARVHGIITHGGDAVNIIPARASAVFSIRARRRAYQSQLVAMLREVADGAAMLTGARLEWAERRGYDNMVPNPTIASLCGQNMQALGLEVIEPSPMERMGSTDMGDISQVMPAIHAYFAIGPDSISGHSIEMTEASCSAAGDQAVVDAAKSLAMTVVDLLSQPDLLDQARAEHQEMLSAGRVAGWETWRENGKRFSGMGDS
ncbi:MAG: M20 family metallopeptidase [Chloroflexota bacterium]